MASLNYQMKTLATTITEFSAQTLCKGYKPKLSLFIQYRLTALTTDEGNAVELDTSFNAPKFLDPPILKIQLSLSNPKLHESI